MFCLWRLLSCVSSRCLVYTFTSPHVFRFAFTQQSPPAIKKTNQAFALARNKHPNHHSVMLNLLDYAIGVFTTTKAMMVSPIAGSRLPDALPAFCSTPRPALFLRALRVGRLNRREDDSHQAQGAAATSNRGESARRVAGAWCREWGPSELFSGIRI